MFRAGCSCFPSAFVARLFMILPLFFFFLIASVAAQQDPRAEIPAASTTTLQPTTKAAIVATAAEPESPPPTTTLMPHRSPAHQQVNSPAPHSPAVPALLPFPVTASLFISGTSFSKVFSTPAAIAELRKAVEADLLAALGMPPTKLILMDLPGIGLIINVTVVTTDMTQAISVSDRLNSLIGSQTAFPHTSARYKQGNPDAEGPALRASISANGGAGIGGPNSISEASPLMIGTHWRRLTVGIFFVCVLMQAWI